MSLREVDVELDGRHGAGRPSLSRASTAMMAHGRCWHNPDLGWSELSPQSDAKRTSASTADQSQFMSTRADLTKRIHNVASVAHQPAGFRKTHAVYRSRGLYGGLPVEPIEHAGLNRELTGRRAHNAALRHELTSRLASRPIHEQLQRGVGRRNKWSRAPLVRSVQSARYVDCVASTPRLIAEFDGTSRPTFSLDGENSVELPCERCH
jgi:hypothetical protein